MIYSDKILSQKLERTEGRSNAAFVESRTRFELNVGAGWIEVGGTYAMFDGVASPLTQTFGLGIFEDATPAQLDKIEAFFQERQAPVFHEVSPMADPSILTLLNERRYKPIELTAVMFQDLDQPPVARPARRSDVVARQIEDGEAELWASIAAEGWAKEQPELYEFLRNLGTIAAQAAGAYPFIAELDGKPIAAGSFIIFDEVCILAGAATIPAARCLGAQGALLKARLDFAVKKGCKLAMMCAAPGSQSQKNAQKNGFNIAYTRTKWQLTRQGE